MSDSESHIRLNVVVINVLRGSVLTVAGGVIHSDPYQDLANSLHESSSRPKKVGTSKRGKLGI